MLLCGTVWTLTFLNNWVAGGGLAVCMFPSGSIFKMEGENELLAHPMSICVMPCLVQVFCSLMSFLVLHALLFSSALGKDSLSHILKIFPRKDISREATFSF